MSPEKYMRCGPSWLICGSLDGQRLWFEVHRERDRREALRTVTTFGRIPGGHGANY